MKFEALLAFWKIKKMIVRASCLTRDRIYNSEGYHVTYMMTIANQSLHANVLYRYEEKNGAKAKFALIYADILYSGFPDRDHNTSLFSQNVRVATLAREFAK